jgi:murein DD-endopeptidase MepM/ murein hydrolase activator NlpD
MADELPRGVDFDALPPEERRRYEQPAPAPRERGEWPRSCAHAPADGSITSPMGRRSSRQTPGETRMHNGLDIWGREGDPVYAIGDGVVEHATRNGARGFARYGRVVVLRHPQWQRGGDDVRSLYAHLSRLTVRPGQRVEAGQRIGAIGNTRGSVDDPGATFAERGHHLHFEVKSGRYPVPHAAPREDPLVFLAQRGVLYTSAGRLRTPDGCAEEPVSSPTSSTENRAPRRRSSAGPLVLMLAAGALLYGMKKS